MEDFRERAHRLRLVGLDDEQCLHVAGGEAELGGDLGSPACSAHEQFGDHAPGLVRGLVRRLVVTASGRRSFFRLHGSTIRDVRRFFKNADC